MEQGVIKVERELRSRLRQVTREELGPEATAAQVEAPGGRGLPRADIGGTIVKRPMPNGRNDKGRWTPRSR